MNKQITYKAKNKKDQNNNNFWYKVVYREITNDFNINCPWAKITSFMPGFGITHHKLVNKNNSNVLNYYGFSETISFEIMCQLIKSFGIDIEKYEIVEVLESE